MVLKNVIKVNSYQDSVFLMSLANQARGLPGIQEVSAMMGTPQNRELLRHAGLLTSEGEAARPDDMIIALRAANEQDVDQALAQIQKWLDRRQAPQPAGEIGPPHTLGSALERMPGANVVLISLPGQYVRWEAQKALDEGRHVMIFSDNVSLRDEVELKAQAEQRGLLVMGPDCGTAILGGKALGFGNVVRRGTIGIVGASGTGIQEVSSLLDRMGHGVSHAIGLGGRDLSEEVQGASALKAIEILQADPQTESIVFVSKPPAPEVCLHIIEVLARSSKPCAVCFQGQVAGVKIPKSVLASPLLEGVAFQAMGFSGKLDQALTKIDGHIRQAGSLAEEEWSRLAEHQRFVRGLFSGGSLCAEAGVVLAGLTSDLFSNIHLPGVSPLKESAVSRAHTLIDLGADEFTVGVPHPMIDFTVRNQRLIQEAQDRQTAVILLDIVLGFGAHSDPAGAILPAILEGKRSAQKHGGYLSCVASICGTRGDPQDFDKQREKLVRNGVVVMPSMAQASRFAMAVARRNLGKWSWPEKADSMVAAEKPAEGQKSPSVRNLLDVPLQVINMGLPSFAESLNRQEVAVLHVDWRPPAGGDPRLLEVLRKLR